MYPFTPLDEIDPRYLLALLLSERFSRFAESVSGRSGIPKINRLELEEFKLPLPPIDQQHRIADILDTFNAAIAASRKATAKRAAVSSALVSERLAAMTAEMPSVMPLQAIAQVLIGVTLGSEPSGFGSVEIPYLRVANVQDGHIDTTDVKTIRVLRPELPRYLLRYGDVLLTEGGDLDKLGRGAMWDGRIPECVCQNHIFRVRCNENVLLPGYLSLYISSPVGKAYFLKIAKQTTNLATINSTQLKVMPLPVPSLGDQISLIEVTASCTESLNAARRRLSKLEAIRQGMMDDLLTERVRVTDGGMERVGTG
jgi:type I restriction enzyme, S subunit